MKFVKHILTCLLTVVLFYISWPPQSLPGFIFIAFVPVLYVLFNFKPVFGKYSTIHLFILLFCTFFSLNFLLTSWLIYAHWFGGIFASIVNGLLMSLVCFSIYKIKVKLGDKQAYFAFPIIWLAFEYLHLNWDLTWPWMSLGNVFAEHPNWIQWYEYTGVLGGSFWVLIVNVLLYFTLNKLLIKESFVKPIVFSTLFIVTPFVLSNKTVSNTNYLVGDEVNIVIVQPNYEPHNVKFTIPQEVQLQEVEKLIQASLLKKPDLVVLPETFITDWIWESRLETAPSVLRLKSWLDKTPKTQILSGASSGKVLKDNQALKKTARKSRNGTIYEVFNSALLLSAEKPTQVFHKSKLVPGAEMTPFSSILKPVFDKFPVKLGGTIGNFGTNDTLQNFKTYKGDFTPIICYESVFGEYVSSFNSLGSSWICIITNDGWWGDTFGHQQHNSYARLRAIENRKYVVRSANTGISSVINPLGMVEQFLPYGESGIIEATITKSHKITFYAKHGDYMGRLASFLTIIYLLQLIISSLKTNNPDLN